MKKFFLNKKTVSALHVGIHFNESGISFAVINKKENILSETLNIYDDFSAIQAKLKKSVEELSLQNVSTTIILPAKDYQVFLIDAPQVSENEKKAALQWKIAEYIDYPIEEAIFDFIELPQNVNVKNTNLIYVVVAQLSKVETLVKWVEQAHLKVISVEIGQSALLEIAIRLKDWDIGQVLLHLDKEKSHLIIFKDKTLYMMRELSIGWDKILIHANKNPKGKEEIYYDLSLEIQRSLDYCMSHIQNASVSNIVLTPLATDHAEILIQLSEALGMPVREMDISELLKISVNESKKTNVNMLAIGAALRWN